MTTHAKAKPLWVTTGALAPARNLHTMTVLANGKILVAGGTDKDHAALDSATLYDPVTGSWTPTGNLRVARVGHTATLLPTGQVLVVGGRSGLVSIDTAELYEPSIGKWISTGSVRDARSSHTATLLTSGLVLAAGGIDAGSFADRLNTAELYSPVSGKWSATGTLTLENGRASHTATLLEDGMVLVVGGNTFGPLMAEGAELYDPIHGLWRSTGTPTTVRVDHTATRLQNGKVLIAGGVSSNGLSAELDSAELYDPIQMSFSATAGLSTGRNRHTATLLRNGEVLITGGFKDVVAGGITNRSTLNVAELYEPSAARWTITTHLREGRGEHTAALLPHGTVLVAGGATRGNDGSAPLNGAELFRSGADGAGDFATD